MSEVVRINTACPHCGRGIRGIIQRISGGLFGMTSYYLELVKR